jgi:hypothetical protein
MKSQKTYAAPRARNCLSLFVDSCYKLRMRLRHAAALVLVSWYLMVPPQVTAPYKVDTEAPLSSWKVYQKFDKAEECDKIRSSVLAKYEHTASAPIGSIKKGTRAFALQMTFAQCVSSEDPALKAK